MIALLIKGDDIPSLIPMAEVIDAMELTLAENASGIAPFYPRRAVSSAVYRAEQAAHVRRADGFGSWTQRCGDQIDVELS